ncbi:MAG: D-aminoacyl-tRNA deacylase [Candidatus Izemoplasmatales bacterium]
MKIVVQRVKNASVKVGERLVSEINQGLVLLVGLHKDDDLKDLKYAASKIAKLRIFSDDLGLMNLNIKQVKGQILSISQFTIYGDVKKQNRPGFSNAMSYEIAKQMYQDFNELLIKEDLSVKEGLFGENMSVSLVNDGPVTIIVDTHE